MKHTMLTTNTLSRFEKEVDISILTEEQIKIIEHDAYCANMGAKDYESAWKWFRHLVIDVDKLNISLTE